MAVFHGILPVLLLVTLSASEECKGVKEYNAVTKGEISSPFYESGKYPEMLSCEYKIKAPQGYRIKLTFKDMDIDPTGNCFGDRLVVYGKSKKNIIGVFCGHTKPNPLVSLEEDNEIQLLFVSDYMVGGRGFKLQYEAAPGLELCGQGQGICRNRNCYDIDNTCDGEDHCGDGTDEEDCPVVIDMPNEDCGEPPIEPKTIYGGWADTDRMVGGEAVKPNSWPWQVSIQHSNIEPNGHFCGGSLISPEWVVSAAHCFQDNPHPESLRIVLGGHHKYKKTKYQQERYAAQIIAYPDLEGEQLKSATFLHDIALIRLNAPVTYNDGVRPVCLPHGGWDIPVGSTCYATGWGETRGSGSSNVLKQMEQITQHVDNCTHEVKTQICVDKPNNAPCHGDSGGPLACKLAHKWYVMGITSFGTEHNMMGGLCGLHESKVIFAKVSDKAHWVRDTVNKHS